ncbi:helix-turn-helix domain-containing protein [Pontiellaceae bacterium B1224]|nr:helix-turn-helix domain-containing protein [Pontiellaceae bacterium B1224]
MQYGQFCPIAKACEILGERWTILIVRELLCGSTRFNQLQRGLSQMSPSLLTKRLNQLVDDEIIFKKKVPGQRRAEYFLTPAGKELAPVVMGMGDWGQKWARSRMEDEELDIELLMLEFFRRLDVEQIPGGTLVAHFMFPQLQTYPHWWMVIDGDDERELCVVHPGRDVDITIKSDAKTMCEIWNGDITFSDAKKAGRIRVEGLPLMKRSVAKWLKAGLLANGSLVDQL